jgi:hypothetical protein
MRKRGPRASDVLAALDSHFRGNDDVRKCRFRLIEICSNIHGPTRAQARPPRSDRNLKRVTTKVLAGTRNHRDQCSVRIAVYHALNLVLAVSGIRDPAADAILRLISIVEHALSPR